MSEEKAPQSNKPRVSLVVSEEQKEEWDEAVKSGEYASLAELVRTSVKRELEGHHALGEADTGSQATADAIDSLAGTMSDLKGTVEDIERRIEELEDRTATESLEYDMDTLVFNQLPTPEKGKMQSQFALTLEEITEKIRSLGIDVSEDEVADSLYRLKERSPVVQSGTTPEGPKFYKTKS